MALFTATEEREDDFDAVLHEDGGKYSGGCFYFIII